jgi:hypothetical protein
MILGLLLPRNTFETVKHHLIFITEPLRMDHAATRGNAIRITVRIMPIGVRLVNWVSAWPVLYAARTIGIVLPVFLSGFSYLHALNVPCVHDVLAP